MYTTLMASSPQRRPWSMSAWGGVSAAVHVLLLAGVLWFTARAPVTESAPVEQVTYIIFPVEPPPPPVEVPAEPEPPPAEVAPAPEEIVSAPEPELPRGFQELEIPREIPVTIPPPSTTLSVRAIDFSGVGVPGGVGEGYVPPPESEAPPLTLAVVDRAPQVKNAAELAGRMRALYPPSLRIAGIEGRAVVQLVVDAQGRVERDGMSLIAATHPEFGAAAMELALLVRFEPARRNGRPVRVWVQLPVDWTIED